METNFDVMSQTRFHWSEGQSPSGKVSPSCLNNIPCTRSNFPCSGMQGFHLQRLAMLAFTASQWPNFNWIPCIFPKIREIALQRHVRCSLPAQPANLLIWTFFILRQKRHIRRGIPPGFGPSDPLKAAETILRKNRSCPDVKISRGAFGGQHFLTRATERIAEQHAQSSHYCR